LLPPLQKVSFPFFFCRAAKYLDITKYIAYGIKGKKVSIDSIIEAAKHANAHEFISALPQGYDTLVIFIYLKFLVYTNDRT